jgi:mRNA interferase MazF
VIRRGDLFWFVDASAGGAIPGIPHPHVVVSDDVLNRSRLPTVTVCALTSNRRRANEPGNVPLDAGEGGLARPSVVVVSQLASAPKDALRDPSVGSRTPGWTRSWRGCGSSRRRTTAGRPADSGLARPNAAARTERRCGTS